MCICIYNYADDELRDCTKDCEYSLLTRRAFHNIMFTDLFNHMHRNSILHTVNNSDAGLITVGLMGLPMDRHTACAKNNNKYKLDCWDYQCARQVMAT